LDVPGASPMLVPQLPRPELLLITRTKRIHILINVARRDPEQDE
jgi:hypothetical protein